MNFILGGPSTSALRFTSTVSTLPTAETAVVGVDYSSFIYHD